MAQLSRLLLAVEQGERFTITVWGKPVADLVPQRADATEVVAATVAALPDRLPSSWYPTGFLVPTNIDLSLRQIAHESLSTD
jgi:hypothetical protein